MALARRLVPWMVSPIHSVEQEAALQEIEAGWGDDATYVMAVLQRTQETLGKLKAAGDNTLIEEPPTVPAKSRQAARKGSPRRSSGTGEALADDAKKKYFSVPYEKRAEARMAGLSWDGDARKWYAPTQEIADRIKDAKVSAGEKARPSTSPSKASSSTSERSASEGDRAYFSVLFAQKDQAKTLGLRFDSDRKAWFASSQEVAHAAAKTFPPQS